VSEKESERPLTLREAVAIGYQRITRQTLEEAARLDSVEVEVSLLRIWLRDTVEDETRDLDLMRRLLDQIVRAVAVKYRLGPKRASDLGAALTALMDHMAAQIAPGGMEV